MKSVFRVICTVQSLPYYMTHIRKNIRKLTILKSRSVALRRTKDIYNSLQRDTVTKELLASKTLHTLELRQELDFKILKNIRKMKNLKSLKMTISQENLINVMICADI